MPDQCGGWLAGYLRNTGFCSGGTCKKFPIYLGDLLHPLGETPPRTRIPLSPTPGPTRVTEMCEACCSGRPPCLLSCARIQRRLSEPIIAVPPMLAPSLCCSCRCDKLERCCTSRGAVCDCCDQSQTSSPEVLSRFTDPHHVSPATCSRTGESGSRFSDPGIAPYCPSYSGDVATCIRNDLRVTSHPPPLPARLAQQRLSVPFHRLEAAHPLAITSWRVQQRCQDLPAVSQGRVYAVCVTPFISWHASPLATVMDSSQH